MRRRDFLALFGGIAAKPATAWAQRTVPTIGFMSSRSPDDSTHLVAAFRGGLEESGFFPGQNVTIEHRWARGDYSRLGEFAREFVERGVAVIATLGGVPPAIAAKQATSSIPIVFSIGPDPVSLGLVASFNRPGGNATGVSLLTTVLESKRLGLLRELASAPRVIGVLLNPQNPPSASQGREIDEAARSAGQQVLIVPASTPAELQSAFETLRAASVSAVMVGADPFFDTQRDALVAFAARQRLPALYQFREYAEAGGLASYGISLADSYRQVGLYVGRILQGTQPGELPVVQPTKFELVINLKTARELGLEIPPTLLARADEVIE